MNMEQSLSDIEKSFEESKAMRLMAKHRWDAAKGVYHMRLVAEREAGRKLTMADIKALKDSSIDTDPDVKEAYLSFISADSNYRAAKTEFDNAVRSYWDSKGQRI